MAGSPKPFRPDGLEARLAPLDALPRTLWLSAIGEMPRQRALGWVAKAYAAWRLVLGAALDEVMRLVESLDGVVNFARWSELRGPLDSEPWQRILEARELIEGALGRIRETSRRQAALLIAHDGEFGPTAETVAAVQATRERLGLGVQGVLFGDRDIPNVAATPGTGVPLLGIRLGAATGDGHG
jgi:hypothetical protein